MSELAGRWQHVRDENFDAYLSKLGVGYLKRKVVGVLHPEVTITVEGDKWSIRTQTSMSDQTVTFTLNEEYEANVKGVVDGMMRCLSTLEDGKLTSDAKPIDAKVKPTVQTREVVNGELVQTMTCDGVVCKRYHTRIA